MANLITPQMLKILMQRRKSAQAKEDKTVNPKIIKPLRREQYGISKRLEQEKAEGSPTEARRIDEYKDYTEEEKIWKTGESPEQLDRPKEVWERFDEELDEGIISPLDDPDPHLDRIHNQLIDEEVITQKYDYDPDLAPTGPAELQPRRQIKKQLQEAGEELLDPKPKIPETSDMTLEELQRTTNRPVEKVEPGEAADIDAAPRRYSDEPDIMNERHERQLKTLTDQLPPHMDTPENRAILEQHIFDADAMDRSVGQVFGRDKEAFPDVVDPDAGSVTSISNVDNFNLRQLEDLFVHGVKGDTPQKRAIERVRAEAAKAAGESGRTGLVQEGGRVRAGSVPVTNPAANYRNPANRPAFRKARISPEGTIEAPSYMRENIARFEKSPVTDPVKEGAMDAVQEKLTGPMRPEVAARQVAQEKAAQQKLMELLLQRLGRELQDQGDLFYEKPDPKNLIEAIELASKKGGGNWKEMQDILKKIFMQTAEESPDAIRQQQMLFPHSELPYDFGPLKVK